MWIEDNGHRMRRREALQAGLTTLALGGSGCTSVSGFGATTSTTTTSTGLESFSPRKVSIENVQSVPDSITAEIEIGLITETITTDHTATIETTLTNTGSETREFNYACKSVLPYPLHSESGVYVFTRYAGETKPSCWEAPSDSDGYPALMCDPTATLEPDESLSTELELWSAIDDGKCMPAGKETFLTDLPFTDGRNEGEWGFTISISQPEETS